MPRKSSPPVVIGHRGHAHSVENTMPAFREAIAMGAQMLELDARLSKDGIPIVFHDRTLRRMTGGGRSNSVAKMSARSLSNVELLEGCRIPTLEEVLAELTPQVPINIELKYDRYEYRTLMTGVADVVKTLGVEDKVLVSSFFHHSLLFLNRRLPTVEVAPLFGLLSGPPDPEDLEAVFQRERRNLPGFPFYGRVAVVDYKLIDEALAQTFADHEATLLTYTVDEVEEMERLVDLGVDGIVTNRPDLLVDYIKERFPTA